MNPSRSRKKVLLLQERLASLSQSFLGRSPLFPGSLYELKTRCGKPQCKCARGDYRHRRSCVSFVEDGASRTRVVTSDLIENLKTMTDDYRRTRKIERQFRQTIEALLAQVEALREVRIAAGRKRYERLTAKHQKSDSSKPRKKGGKKK
jgi:hypothetical protein